MELSKIITRHLPKRNAYFMLKITNLEVEIDNKKILKDISLSINPGELHVLLGPNGAGKTSLVMALMGHPGYKYQITNNESQINLDGKDLTNLAPEKRAEAGLFISFQKPVAIPGVTVKNLLTNLIRENLEEKISVSSKGLKIKEELLTRALNENFSGGEAKKMELLQADILKPKYLILDEIDSGLDIDNLQLLANKFKEILRRKAAVLLITHNLKILKLIKPDKLHILIDGAIVKSDGPELSSQIEKKGFSWLIQK